MKKNLLIIIFFFYIPASYSDTNIAYIDINFILKNSLAGKSLNKHITLVENKFINKFKPIETELIKKEENLILQKNILEKNEFENRLKALSVEVNKYREDRKKSNEEVNKIRINSTKKILSYLNPIIADYVEKNSISLVLPKKNIIVGKKNLDITDVIINLIDKDIKAIDF